MPDHTVHSVSATQPRATTDYTRPLRDDIERLEKMRDVFVQVGSPHRLVQIDALLVERRRQLEQAQSGPRELSADVKSAAREYLAGVLSHPPSTIPDDLRRPLECFKTLIDAGIQLTDASSSRLEDVEAFAQLERHVWHAPYQQVMYQTRESDGRVKMSTLRPEYLEGLAHYVDGSKNGTIFYDAEGRAIDSPGRFLELYKEDPTRARVRSIDGSLMTVNEARRREAEWARRMLTDAANDPARPQVEDLGDSVSVGGVVLKKRR